MYDDSPEAMKKRADARRERMTMKVCRIGEEPEVDEEVLAMTPGERFDLGLRLTCMGYDILEENDADLRRLGRRLPRSDWPVHIVRR